MKKLGEKYVVPVKTSRHWPSDKLHTLKERPDCLCERYFNKMEVISHKLDRLLPDKRL